MRDETAMIETDYGIFSIKLEMRKAPATAGYFRQLIEQGALDGSEVFRIVNSDNGTLRSETPIHVVQAGWRDPASPHVRALPHETTAATGLTHKKWAVSTAREGVSETYASFFVCMRDEPALDFGGARHPDGQGFAVFGEIVSGFDVLDKVFAQAEAGEYLERPLPIKAARLTHSDDSLLD